MLRTLSVVVSIALADSLNPTTVGPGLFLASGRCPRRSVLEFTLGTAAVFLLGGLILLLGPGHAILALLPQPSANTRYILETAAGVVMLALSPLFWRRRGRVSPPSPPEQRRQRSPAVMGAAISVVELPTAFPYFAAIATIVGSGLGTVRQLILLGIYDFIFVLPLLGMVLALMIGGERAVRRLVAARDWGRRNWPTIAATVALAVGLFVLTLGVTGLTEHQRNDVGTFSRTLRHLITKP